MQVWDRMKDYIERHHPEDHSSHDKLRRVVKEAWEAVGAISLGARDARGYNMWPYGIRRPSRPPVGGVVLTKITLEDE